MDCDYRDCIRYFSHPIIVAIKVSKAISTMTDCQIRFSRAWRFARSSASFSDCNRADASDSSLALTSCTELSIRETSEAKNFIASSLKEIGISIFLREFSSYSSRNDRASLFASRCSSPSFLMMGNSPRQPPPFPPTISHGPGRDKRNRKEGAHAPDQAGQEAQAL